jgi:hypothetical protein
MATGSLCGHYNIQTARTLNIENHAQTSRRPVAIARMTATKNQTLQK